MHHKILSALGFFIVIMTLLLTPQHGYSQSPTTTPTPTIEVAATMDAAPTNCGSLPDALTLDPDMGSVIGAWPIWLSAGGTRGVILFPATRYQTRDELVGWWMNKMGWFVSKTYTGEVKIQAFNVADHSPVYFEFGDTHAPTTPMTLNPAKPGGFVDGITDWAFFPSLLWISKAGCYQLEATWDGGSWTQIVAIGAGQ